MLILAGLPAPSPGIAQGNDAARGQELFPIRCGQCHAIGEGSESKAGPNLAGLMGRPAGTLEGFDYSDAMKASGIVWSEDALKSFLAAPRKVVPGTRMNFNGLKRPGETEAIVGYLMQATQ